MKPLPITKSCFVCGRDNPYGLQLRFHADDQVAVTSFTPTVHHAGFQQVVHGGILATVLDEVMVWGCGIATHRFAYCAEMTVRYVAPGQPGVPIIARGELATNKRDRLFEAKGQLTQNGSVIATSTGKYIPLPPGQMADALKDFAEDPSTLFERP